MACVELEVLKAGEELTAAKTREPLLRNISVKQQSHWSATTARPRHAVGNWRLTICTAAA